MNFVAFPVGATNIFPLANSSEGGQLLSEFNMRSRESVATDSSVKYFIGPSFTHSLDDFAVYSQRDGHDVTISNTVIQVQPGRALVNGHFVELLTPINIDLNEANAVANREGIPALKGKLAVGLRMAYNTYQTLAGSALVENKDNYYDGIQVVVVPVDAVKLPKDVPGDTEFTKVNMHLLLATFTFRNGTVSAVTQNEAKIQSLSAERVGGISNILSDTFVSKAGLDPYKLYVFAGKSSDGQTIDGRDTWCNATDSLVVWDKNPSISSTSPSNEASFEYDSIRDETVLVAAHKQIDGGMVDTHGTPVYFQDKRIPLPAADFGGNGGVVTKAYTNRIIAIKEKMDALYNLPNGKMRQYIAVLTSRDDLPTIPVSEDIRWPYSDSEYKLSLSQLKAAIAEIRSSLSQLEESIPDMIDNQISGSINNYIDQNSTITNLSSSIQDIQSRLSAIEGTLSDMSSDTPTEALVLRLQAIETELSDPQTGIRKQISDINTELATIETDVNRTIDNKIANINQNIANQFNQISEALQIQFDSLSNNLYTYIDTQIKTAIDDHSVMTKWTWRLGDYILVGEDHTVNSTVDGRYPSTMYIVGPGKVTSIKLLVNTNNNPIKVTADLHPSDASYQSNKDTYFRKTPKALAGGVELDASEITSESDLNPSLWNIGSDQYKGQPGTDYFVARMKTETESEGQVIEHWTSYFYVVSTVDTTYSYVGPVLITGGVPLATDTSVGGFVNVPANTYGGGYITMDENGHLRLIDYELLLTGVLAYQLGQDYSEGSGLSLTELQNILDNNINERVCFPNAVQIQNATEAEVDPYVIHLYLELPEEAGSITIHDIGSRYGSSLYLHIKGSATSATIINIYNCDKLRIDNNIEGAPSIYLDNVHLYYDAEVMDTVANMRNLTLWYQRYYDTDPLIQVDGMTVSLVGRLESSDGIDPWDSIYANDNHYMYGLRSLTFGSDGSIINIGLVVGDSTTANIDEGISAFVSDFTLPQSMGLNYPPSCMTHRIKVTGTFVSHYWVPSESAYMMKSTEFSALTQKYDPITRTDSAKGTIAFYTNAQYLSHINGLDTSVSQTVDCWDMNTPNFFIGGVVE